MKLGNLGVIAIIFFLSLGLSAQNSDESNLPEQTTTPDVVSGDDDATPAEELVAPAKPVQSRVEKIEVTGSHIKRIDVEGPSPVLTLDRDYLDRTGYNSVADVLRDTTVAGLGGQREAGLSGGAESGAATTSVRGMDANSVLVLLDGRRMPTIGGTTRVDLNLIPMAAIERVEILKDGASAIYGSDALGGVINFITKRKYDGAVVALTHSQPEEKGGAKTDVTGTYGKTGAKYDFLGVLQYRNNQSVAMRDRDFMIPTDDYLSPTGSPGSYKNHDASNSNWTAGGGSDPCTGSTDGSGRCRFDYSPYMNVIPDIEQFSALLNGGYQISETLEAFGRVMLTRREVNTRLAPAPDSFEDERDVDGFDTRIPKATADAWGLTGTTVNGTDAGKDVDVMYRLVEEAGPRMNKTTSDSGGVTSGVKGYIGDTWDWEFSGNYAFSKTTNKGISGYANKTTLRNMAVANPASFNPFAAPGSKSNISQAFYTPVLDIFSSVGGMLLKATGEVYEMPNGPLSVAVGLSTNWQTFEQTSDAVTNSGAQWGGGTSAEGKGHRDFQSFYSEFSLPILTNLEVQLAGRFDNFSDFGSTVNPKVGFRYKPFNALMLRGSWGTGFKAPALEDLYGAQTVAFPFGDDPKDSDGSIQIKQFGGGNPNLKQETSSSLNLGFVWQILESLSFGTDYYVNNQDDVVSDGSLRDIFRAEAAGIDLNKYGINIVRSPAVTGAVDRIIAPKLNLAARQTEGLEFRLAYDENVFGSWRLNVLVDYSLILKLDETPFPGLPSEQRVGFAGNPYWRNNTGIGLSNQTWGFNTLVRTVGEQDKSFFAPGAQGKTRDHTEVDLQAQYSSSWDGLISVGIRNAFGTDRPRQLEHLSSGFVNTSLYDPFGRTVFVNYSQSF